MVMMVKEEKETRGAKAPLFFYPDTRSVSAPDRSEIEDKTNKYTLSLICCRMYLPQWLNKTWS